MIIWLADDATLSLLPSILVMIMIIMTTSYLFSLKRLQVLIVSDILCEQPTVLIAAEPK